MCELLVKSVDATHPDPVINLSGCYKRGDVVVIQPDGFMWGTGELDTSVFEIVKMPGVAIADMQYLLNPNEAPLPKSAAMHIPALRKEISKKLRDTLNRKRFSIDLTTQQITDKARI